MCLRGAYSCLCVTHTNMYNVHNIFCTARICFCYCLHFVTFHLNKMWPCRILFLTEFSESFFVMLLGNAFSENEMKKKTKKFIAIFTLKNTLPTKCTTYTDLQTNYWTFSSTHTYSHARISLENQSTNK